MENKHKLVAKITLLQPTTRLSQSQKIILSSNYSSQSVTGESLPLKIISKHEQSPKFVKSSNQRRLFPNPTNWGIPSPSTLKVDLGFESFLNIHLAEMMKMTTLIMLLTLRLTMMYMMMMRRMMLVMMLMILNPGGGIALVLVVSPSLVALLAEVGISSSFYKITTTNTILSIIIKIENNHRHSIT